jgi:hypothetical protein
MRSARRNKKTDGLRRKNPAGRAPAGSAAAEPPATETLPASQLIERAFYLFDIQAFNHPSLQRV